MLNLHTVLVQIKLRKLVSLEGYCCAVQSRKECKNLVQIKLNTNNKDYL